MNGSRNRVLAAAVTWLALAVTSIAGCGGGSTAGTGAEVGSRSGDAPPLKLSGPPVVVDLSQPVPSCPEPPPPPVSPKQQPAFLIQRNHGRPILYTRLSRDGRVMVTAGLDGTVRVWDTATGLLVRRLLTESSIPKIALSASGSTLAYYAPDATAGGKTTISLVDLSTGADPIPVTQYGEMSLAPDGKRFAVALTALTLYDARGKKIKELDLGMKAGHIALTLASDPAWKRLAVAAPGEIIVVDVDAWKVAARFPLPNPTGPTDYAMGLAFSSDAFVTRSTTGAVQILDARGAPRFRLPAAAGYLDSVVAGSRLFTIDRMTSKVEAWDVTTGQSVPFRAAEPRTVNHLAVSEDASTLALVTASPTEGNFIALQDGLRGAHLRTIEGPPAFITALAMRPDGEEITTGSSLSVLTRWSSSTGEMSNVSPWNEQSPVESLSYDGPGAQIAWTVGTYFVRVREAKTGRMIRQWKPHGDQQVIFAGFLPGKTDLITAGRDGSVMRWDLSGLLPVRPPKPVTRFDELHKPQGVAVGSFKRPARRGALSPNGALLALDDDKGALGVINLGTGVVRWDTSLPISRFRFVEDRWIAFSPDSALLYVSRIDIIEESAIRQRLTPALRVIDASNGTIRKTVFPETAGAVATRGDLVAVGGFRPALLDAQTLAKKVSVTPVDREVTAIAAHPRRPLFVMSGDGGSTMLVHTDKGSVSAVLVATSSGDFMTATPDGAFLSSLDGARSVAWAFPSPLESFGFDQFASKFDRPDIVRKRLAGEPADAPGAVNRPPSLDLAKVSLASAERGVAAEVSAQGSVLTTSSDRVSLRADVASDRRVERVRAFVNGRPAVDKLVCAAQGSVDLEVPLQGGRNRVSLLAYDADGYASNPRKLDVISTAPGAPRPDLWLLAVGVSKYENLGPDHQLEYADDDARSVAQALSGEAGPGKPFARLHATTLLDAEVTVERLEQAVEAFSAMGPDDLAVLFLAGHGVRLPEDKMVFLTSKASLSAEGARGHGVGWDRIQGALNRAKGRVLVLLDACHSGHVSTDIIAPNEDLAQELASKGRAGVLIFAAARGSQLSYEVPPGGLSGGTRALGAPGARGLELIDDLPPAPLPTSLMGGHGLFTSAVLEAIAGGATDRDRSGAVETAEFTDYVTWRVKAVSRGAQTPWIARREMFGDFVIAPASR